ncbi:YopX family protein, partial [Jeotgalibaca porci]|uniref:YopX family protein n=1 Tax=Jeotgalibaca porci TaxID=1868793 RepID=UPI00359F7096
MIPKFRAWDKINKEMRDVWQIDFRDVYDEMLLSDYFDGAWSTFDGVFLMQFTGLIDSNGAEVYFNDIVEDEYGHRYEVAFEGDCLRC